MDVGIITETLNAFIGAFSGGFDSLRPAITGLLRVLLTLDVIFFFYMLAFEAEQLRGAFRKLLGLSLWIYVIQDFDTHAENVVMSLVQAGLMAAGQGGQDPRTLLDPSRILEGSFEATAPLANNLLNTGLLDLTDMGSMIVFGFSYIFIMLAYAALAINCFIAVIEYYMALAVCGILMPFGLLKVTRWLAMKPVSFLVASGIKLMTIAFIMAIGQSVLGRIRFRGDEPELNELWVMLFVSGTLAMLAWIAPQRFASGFMAGSASLGGSDAVSFAIPVAAGAALGVSPLVGGVRAAGHAASGGASESSKSPHSPAGGSAPTGPAASTPPNSSAADLSRSASKAHAPSAKASGPEFKA